MSWMLWLAVVGLTAVAGLLLVVRARLRRRNRRSRHGWGRCVVGDPLSAARGILLAAVLGAAVWAAVLWAVFA